MIEIGTRRGTTFAFASGHAAPEWFQGCEAMGVRREEIER
jgi:hypothetical protein